jgi:hypothetical protein
MVQKQDTSIEVHPGPGQVALPISRLDGLPTFEASTGWPGVRLGRAGVAFGLGGALGVAGPR